MKWRASVGVRVTIEYDDIEADTQEEAEEIAKGKAQEDIEYNNCECDEDYTVYSCYPNDEENDCNECPVI